jgi:hypothetical protein
MKKTIIASILGIAACAAVSTSYGQGSFIFVNYSFGASSYSAPVTFGGQVVGSDYTAQLLFSATGSPGTFQVVLGATSQFFGTGLGDTADGGGWFPSVGVTVPGTMYTSGPAYFEIQVQNSGDTIAGTSGVFEYSTLATAANTHSAQDPFPDSADVVTPLQAFTVQAVPEPTTLALAGLGGLASLIALRRKQA